jgi:hypothetical protein
MRNRHPKKLCWGRQQAAVARVRRPRTVHDSRNPTSREQAGLAVLVPLAMRHTRSLYPGTDAVVRGSIPVQPTGEGAPASAGAKHAQPRIHTQGVERARGSTDDVHPTKMPTLAGIDVHHNACECSGKETGTHVVGGLRHTGRGWVCVYTRRCVVWGRAALLIVWRTTPHAQPLLLPLQPTCAHT